MTDSVRLKWLLTESDERAGTLADTLPLLSVSISWGVRRRESSDMITRAAAEDLSNYKVCRAGDMVINRMRAFQGALGIAPESGVVSPDYAVLQVDPTVNRRWLNYFLTSSSTVSTMASMVRGIGGTDAGNVRTPRLNVSDLQSMIAPVVSAAVQRAIADYLDRETARIDTLIEEQQRLIDMLRERRLSVITEAVCGQSSPGRSPTRGSWFSRLPNGWACGRVKSVAERVTDGAHISPDTVGGVFDFVSTRDISAGSIDFDSALKTSSETYEYMVKTGCRPYAGDVLFSKDGTVGETAVVRESRPFVVASSLVIVSPISTRMTADYLAYVFASKTAKEQAASMMRGAGLPRLSVGNLARLEVPIPPLDTQRDIVAHLDGQTAQIDTLIVESERFIGFSRERRSALITAAVTGQIDVREMA